MPPVCSLVSQNAVHDLGGALEHLVHVVEPVVVALVCQVEQRDLQCGDVLGRQGAGAVLADGYSGMGR